METMTDFIFLGSKITADGDSGHEIKRHYDCRDSTQGWLNNHAATPRAGKPWPTIQVQLATCFCKRSFMGTQLWPFIYALSAFMRQGRIQELLQEQNGLQVEIIYYLALYRTSPAPELYCE